MIHNIRYPAINSPERPGKRRRGFWGGLCFWLIALMGLVALAELLEGLAS